MGGILRTNVGLPDLAIRPSVQLSHVLLLLHVVRGRDGGPVVVGKGEALRGYRLSRLHGLALVLLVYVQIGGELGV